MMSTMRGDSYTSSLWGWLIRWAFLEPRAVAPDSRLAWLVFFAALLSMFTVSAVAYSFGAFVNLMMDEFDASRGISGILGNRVHLLSTRLCYRPCG